MNVVITSEVVQAYSLCPRKAYLLMYGKERGMPHEYEQILRRHQFANQAKNLELLKQKHTDVYPYSVSNLEKGYEFLIDVTLAADNLQAYCSILARVNNLSYELTIFIGTHTINNTDKLSLMFASYVLTKIQGKSPAVGHIVNMKGESRRLKLEESHKVLKPLLEPLQRWLSASSLEELPIILNKHCPVCQFREQCQKKAIQEDNLSCLAHVTSKVIRRYERKGIFTVKQLSYLFKPRKRKKRSKNPPPIIHSLELQALAIKEGRIYLKELPEISRKDLEIFLDIEGNPDEGNYYLIGMLVCQAGFQKYCAFWADSMNEEEKIWRDFLDLVNQYPDAPIYHYGSYEPKALAKLAKAYEIDISSLSKRLVNLNSVIYGKIYFPTYSNQLKEIGHFVGAKWTSSNASGLQSLVWRNNWEEAHASTHKESLLTYNKEDCEALKLLIDRLSQIKQSDDCQSEIEFADKNQHPKKEIHIQLRSILKFSYLDYDKKKISFRQEKKKEDYETKRERNKNKSRNHKQKLIKLRSKVQKVIRIPLREVCSKCEYKPLHPCKLETKRLIIDLNLTKSGVKKTMKELVGVYEYCPKCKRSYPPLFGYKPSQVYGHGIKAWITYHRVALRLPYESISESLDEQFKETISSGSIPRLIKHLATNYAETENSIIQHLLESPFIHADETQISIQGIN